MRKSARDRRSSRAAVRAAASALLVATLAVPGVATAATAPAAPASAPVGAAVDPALPDVIPSLSDWTDAEGSWTLAAGTQVVTGDDAALDGAAGILADELGAILGEDVPVVPDATSASAVDLSVDAARTDLGEEGYALSVDTGGVTIVGATAQGAFYGTRTLAQMLGQQVSLPAGSTVDVPEYAERGVTLCACQINVSEEWIDRLLEEMASLKLNYLLVELKLKSATHPETATWSYYTPEQLGRIVEKADALGIDVIPEINSPGHLEIWLENKPELQLVDKNGVRDEVRLDITKPEAFEFYTDLLDEYLDVFTSDYWHMGADEYMISTGFQNFPQIGEYAKSLYGPDATPDDAFIKFVNDVNAYVKTEHGKTLRIWNDGLTGRNTQPVDADIVVEHWVGTPVGPQALLDAGHEVMNSSYALYLVRGGLKMNTKNLYDQRWNVGKFYGGATVDPAAEGLTGAKISLWPDSAAAQTEHSVEEEMFMPLRFIAQTTWSAEYAKSTYAEFETLARSIGRPLGWDNVDREPVWDGDYTLTTADAGTLGATSAGTLTAGADVEDSWTLTATADEYHTVRSAATGLCLDVVEGDRRLGVPVEIGVPVAAATCGTSNIQKWQLLERDGGFQVVNASTRQLLAIDADGAVVQLPPDVTSTLWSVQAAGGETPGAIAVNGGTLTNPQAGGYQVGDVLAFTYTVRNLSDAVATVSPTGNLEGFDPADGTPSCRYPELPARGEYTCTTGEHTVTQADVDAGVFTPVTTWTSTSGEHVTTVEHTGRTLYLGAPGNIAVRAVHTNPQEAYAVGDVLRFTYDVRNLSTATTQVVPTGNLESLDPAAAGQNCRYRVLPGEGSYTCTFPYHVVTQADLDAGSFTPQTTWTSTSGSSVTAVQVDGPAVDLAPGATVTLDVQAATRCLAGKAYVAVTARNTGDEPADVTLRTPFGERTVTGVAPGSSAYRSFATRAGAVDAGSAEVDSASGTTEVEYAALTCG